MRMLNDQPTVRLAAPAPQLAVALQSMITKVVLESLVLSKTTSDKLFVLIELAKIVQFNPNSMLWTTETVVKSSLDEIFSQKWIHTSRTTEKSERIFPQQSSQSKHFLISSGIQRALWDYMQ